MRLKASPALKGLKSHDSSSRVFEHIMSTDLFNHGGQHVLVEADIRSGWTITHRLGHNMCARDVITVLRNTSCEKTL